MKHINDEFGRMITANYSVQERLLITDSPRVHKKAISASKCYSRYKLFWILASRVVQFLWKTTTSHCFWQTVIDFDEFPKDETIVVKDTLFICIQNYKKTKWMVPRLAGTYKSLIIIGRLKFEDFKKLCHNKVIEIFVQGFIIMSAEEFEKFLDFVKERIENPDVRFNYFSGLTLPGENIDQLNTIGAHNSSDHRGRFRMAFFDESNTRRRYWTNRDAGYTVFKNKSFLIGSFVTFLSVLGCYWFYSPYHFALIFIYVAICVFWSDVADQLFVNSETYVRNGPTVN
uniref:Anoctamin n=1 Tax=Panagrellus redivivus TaxID=6233 RepID=A0A7E4VYA4_PANRE